MSLRNSTPRERRRQKFHCDINVRTALFSRSVENALYQSVNNTRGTMVKGLFQTDCFDGDSAELLNSLFMSSFVSKHSPS